MYVCLYIYRHICMYMYVYARMYMCVYIYTHMCVHSTYGHRGFHTCVTRLGTRLKMPAILAGTRTSWDEMCFALIKQCKVA